MVEGIEKRVRDVANQIVCLPEDATLDYPLEELCMDSLDVAEFVTELEEEFDISIDDNMVNIFGWKTLGDVISFVEVAVAKKGIVG